MEHPHDLRVQEGESARFMCRVSPSMPLPVVTWFFQGKPIANTEMFRIELTNDGYTSLEIPKVDIDDAGVYTVRASNPAGMVEASAMLYVKGIVL